MRDHDNTCPNRSQHTPCPAGYTAWHVWARKMGKTHYQITCPGCGRYSIWVPKSERHEQTRPAAAKHAQPCPQCGAEYPVVVPLWRWLKGDYRNKSLIQICTACGIAANTPPPEAAPPQSEMDDEDLPTTTVYEHYEFDCPCCGEVNDCGDVSPAGSVVECEFCDAKAIAR